MRANQPSEALGPALEVAPWEEVSGMSVTSKNPPWSSGRRPERPWKPRHNNATWCKACFVCNLMGSSGFKVRIMLFGNTSNVAWLSGHHGSLFDRTHRVCSVCLHPRARHHCIARRSASRPDIDWAILRVNLAQTGLSDTISHSHGATLLFARNPGDPRHT